MCVGSSSEASAAAFGLPVRNGSTSTRVSPSVSSKQACPRKRMSTFSLLRCLLGPRSSELAGELPAHGHADQHAHAGLLREQRLDPGGAGGLVRLGDGGAYLRLMGGAEPAALLQRVRQDALELRRRRRDQPLRSREALGVRERPHGGVHLLVGEHQGVLVSLWQQQAEQRTGERAADGRGDVRRLGRQRQQHQHRRDHVHAKEVVLAVVAAPRREAVVHEPGHAAGRAPRRSPRSRSTRRGRRAAAGSPAPRRGRLPPPRHRMKVATTATGPKRRSRSVPKMPTATSATKP